MKVAIIGSGNIGTELMIKVLRHSRHLELATMVACCSTRRRPAHVANSARLASYGKRPIDLTPAELGPFVVPAVNREAHLAEPNVNMVTCGGQATIPMWPPLPEWFPSSTPKSSPRSPRSPPDRAPGRT